MPGASTTDVCHHGGYSPSCSSQGPSDTFAFDPIRNDSHSNAIDISPARKVGGDEKNVKSVFRHQIKRDGVPPQRRKLPLLDRSCSARKACCDQKINQVGNQEKEASFHHKEHEQVERSTSSRMSSEHVTTLSGKMPSKTFANSGTPSELGGTASSSSTVQESSRLSLPFSRVPHVRPEEGKGMVTMEKCVEANESSLTSNSSIVRAQSISTSPSSEKQVIGSFPILLPPQGVPFPSPCSSHRTVLQKPAMTPLWPFKTITTPSSSVVFHDGDPSTGMKVIDTTSVREAPVLPQETMKSSSTDRSAADRHRTSTASSRTTHGKNGLHPCQFKRAIQLLNSMVENERKIALASQGRCRESGWVTKWACSSTASTNHCVREEEIVHPSMEKQALFSSPSLTPSPSQGNLSLTAETSAHPPGLRLLCASKATSEKTAGPRTSFPSPTASRSAVQALLPLQPIWVITDGVETLLLLDFNGSEEHQNYKESLPHYLEQLASTLNQKEMRKSTACASSSSKEVHRVESGGATSLCIEPHAREDSARVRGMVSSPFLHPQHHPAASITWLSVNVEDLRATAPTADLFSTSSTSHDGACIPISSSRVTSLHLFPPSVGSPCGTRKGTRHTKPPLTAVHSASWHILGATPVASSSSIEDSSPSSAAVQNTKRDASLSLLKLSLSAFYTPFAKPSALMICLQGSILVHQVLEEMCNGYLPLFLEGPYSCGVTLEGRWCGRSPASPVDSVWGCSSPFSSLWRRSACASPELDAADSNSTVWTALFPAVENARREAEGRQHLGELCIPFTILSDIQHVTMDRFPVYLPLPRWSEKSKKYQLKGKKERQTTSRDGRVVRDLQSALGSPTCRRRAFLSASSASNGWQGNEEGDEDGGVSTPQTASSSLYSSVFQGEGKRLGGTLRETEARAKLMQSFESLRSTTSSSCSSPSSSRCTFPSALAPKPGIRRALGDVEAAARPPLSPFGLSASTTSSPPSLSPLPLPALPLSPVFVTPFRAVLHRSASTFSCPSFSNGRRGEGEANRWSSPHRWSQSSLPLLPGPGGRSGVEKPSILREDLSYVGVLVATGPLLKMVWGEFIMQRRGDHSTPTSSSSDSRRRKSSTSPTLCSTVLIYTPFGKVYLERLLPSVERWDRPHSTPSVSDGPLSSALASSSSASFGSPSPVFLDTPMVKIEDCRNSLLQSAFGRSMRLKEDQIQFIVAPGGPILCSQEVISTSHAVLRMVTGRKSM